MIWATLKMALAMGAVMAFLFFGGRLFKRLGWGRKNSGSDNGVRVLSSKLIAPQKYVSLVEIAGEVLALGVSAQQITFLAKIENKEMVKKSLSHPALRPEALSWFKAFPSLQKKVQGEMPERGDEK